MVNDASGKWIGIGVGDSDNPGTPRNAPNWDAVTLINQKLHDKYQWARDLGVTYGPAYTQTTAAAVAQFCTRTGLPEVVDPSGFAVANLTVRQRLGSYPPPPQILPICITVEGHMSNMFFGPCADTATQLESEGLCHHQPTGYDNGKIPFDNASGVSSVVTTLSGNVTPGGKPFPAGTPWELLHYSQGGIVGYDLHANWLAPGMPLEWREADRIGTLAYGDPCRAEGSIAPWAVSWITKPNTHGLDPASRYGLPGCPTKPDNFMDVYREGDIFAENDDSLAGQMKAAIYQLVARGKVLTGTNSLLSEIAQVFKQPLSAVIAIFEAIVSGISFLGDQPNPHYAPYDITGGLNWSRGLLRAALAKAA